MVSTQGMDLAKTGEKVRDTAIRVLNKILAEEDEDTEVAIFNAFEKVGATLNTQTIKKGSYLWWGTVIPNVVTAMSLKSIAREKEPGLVAGSNEN